MALFNNNKKRSSNRANSSSTIMKGNAGEHLALAYAYRQGVVAHKADEGTKYDVILDHNGVLLRVFVVASSYSRKKDHVTFKFNRKNSRVDVWALVDLDTMQVAWLSEDKRISTLTVDKSEFEGFSLEKVLQI